MNFFFNLKALIPGPQASGGSNLHPRIKTVLILGSKLVLDSWSQHHGSSFGLLGLGAPHLSLHSSYLIDGSKASLLVEHAGAQVGHDKRDKTVTYTSHGADVNISGINDRSFGTKA